MCEYCRVNPETREADKNVPLIDETRDGISSFVTLDIYEPDEIYGLRVAYLYGRIDLRKHGVDV